MFNRKDKPFEQLIPEQKLLERVAQLGEQITADYRDSDKELVLLGVLKGSFVFLADLVRRVRRPLMVDFLVAASYGSGTVSSGNVKLVYDPEADFEGKHVLVVEDIVTARDDLVRRGVDVGEIWHTEPGPGSRPGIDPQRRSYSAGRPSPTRTATAGSCRRSPSAFRGGCDRTDPPQSGRTAEESAAAAGRYMADAKQIVV